MPLPTFVIAVAQKSGTTTLHDMLSQHPQVFMSEPKEVHFFDRHFEEGLAWYSRQFSPTPEQVAIGESTPYYMYNRTVRARMLESLPGAKFIAILREPAARAYSHYWFAREKGVERLSTFEEAVEREPKRLARSADGQPHARSYVDRGFYIDQLEAIDAVVGRERVLVLLMEDLLEAPAATLHAVFDFLEVDPSWAERIELPVTNRFGADERRSWGPSVGERAVVTTTSSGSYPPMDPATKATLRSRYREANERLATYLGRDLHHWNT